jgi:hypothetical protein
VLLILPFIVFMLACLLRAAGGPFWLAGNSDPSYLYLFNSLYILDGISPMFTDHPGTPLQVLIAGIIKCAHPFFSGEQRLIDAAAQAEGYLHIAWGSLLLFFCVSLWHVGMVVRKHTQSWMAGVCVQLPGIFLLSFPFTNLPVLANVSAETLLAGLMNIYVAVLLKLALPITKGGVNAWKDVIFCACCSAACLVTKLTFLPFIFLPVFFITTWRRRLTYLAGVVVCSALLTFPIWPRLGKFSGWVWGLIFMTGAHGSGEPGFWNLAGFISSIFWVIQAFWILFVLAAGGIVLGVVKGSGRLFVAKLSIVLSMFILFQLVFIAKQHGAQYMAPAVGVAGLLLAVILLMLGENFSGVRYRNTQWIIAGFLVSLVVMGAGRALARAALLDAVRRDLTGFYQRVRDSNSECVKAGAYRSSSPGFALFFGHSMHYYKGQRTLYFRYYGKMLASQYPDVYVYDYWTGRLSMFGRDIPVSQAAQDMGCIMVQSQESGRFPVNWWEEVDKSVTGEKLYRLRMK